MAAAPFPASPLRTGYVDLNIKGILWILPTGSLVAEGVSRRRHVLDDGLNHLGFSGAQLRAVSQFHPTTRWLSSPSRPVRTDGAHLHHLERAAHARSVATAKGPPLGSPHRHRRRAARLRQPPPRHRAHDQRNRRQNRNHPAPALYRHLPPREPEPLNLGTTPRRWQDTCWRIRDARSPLQSKDVLWSGSSGSIPL